MSVAEVCNTAGLQCPFTEADCGEGCGGFTEQGPTLHRVDTKNSCGNSIWCGILRHALVLSETVAKRVTARLIVT